MASEAKGPCSSHGGGIICNQFAICRFRSYLSNASKNLRVGVRPFTKGVIMDFIDRIRELSARIPKQLEHIQIS
jgi:hypothetical protein